MSIIYSLISQGSNVLCEKATAHGNFPDIARLLVSKLVSEEMPNSVLSNSTCTPSHSSTGCPKNTSGKNTPLSSVSTSASFSSDVPLVQAPQQVYANAEKKNTRRQLSYAYDKYLFHFLIETESRSGLSFYYLCMCEQAAGRRLPFLFLSHLCKDFGIKFYDKVAVAAQEGGPKNGPLGLPVNGGEGPCCPPGTNLGANFFYKNSLQSLLSYDNINSNFRQVLSHLLQKYNSDDADKLTHIRSQIHDIQEVMVQNIDKILMRQEKLDILVEKTGQLEQSGLVFRRDAAELRRVMWWRNCKVGTQIGLMIVFVIFIFIWWHCGIAFDKC